MKKENQHIIESLKSQDKEAIAILYDQYGPTLYGVVLKIVRSEAIAQDVLQEAFIKIWKNGPRFNGQKGSLFTWMLNITRNTAIDKTRSAHFRQGGKIQTIDEFVYNDKKLSDEPNVDQIGLRNIVSNLDERYREVIDLVYFQGYTQKEVMEELDIPLGTVKSRVRLALRELRKFFGEFKLVISIACWYLGQIFGSF